MALRASSLSGSYPDPLAGYTAAAEYLTLPTMPKGADVRALEATLATERERAAQLIRGATATLRAALVAAGLPEAQVRTALARVDVLPAAIRRAVLVSKLPAHLRQKLLGAPSAPLGDGATWDETIAALRRVANAS